MSKTIKILLHAQARQFPLLQAQSSVWNRLSLLNNFLMLLLKLIEIFRANWMWISDCWTYSYRVWSTRYQKLGSKFHSINVNNLINPGPYLCDHKSLEHWSNGTLSCSQNRSREHLALEYVHASHRCSQWLRESPPFPKSLALSLAFLRLLMAIVWTGSLFERGLLKLCWRFWKPCILECHPLYHLPATKKYHLQKNEGQQEPVPGVSKHGFFRWPFEIGSQRVGDILNWVTRKSVAWLDLGFRESVEQVVIEVKISVTPGIYRTNTAKKQINRHVVLLI